MPVHYMEKVDCWLSLQEIKELEITNNNMVTRDFVVVLSIKEK